MDISFIFNVVDFYKYHEPYDEVVVSKDYPKKKIEEVEQYWISELARAQEEKITMSI